MQTASGINSRACFSRSAVFFAAQSAIGLMPCIRHTSSVCVPIEPVLPSRAIFFIILNCYLFMTNNAEEYSASALKYDYTIMLLGLWGNISGTSYMQTVRQAEHCRNGQEYRRVRVIYCRNPLQSIHALQVTQRDLRLRRVPI